MESLQLRECEMEIVEDRQVGISLAEPLEAEPVGFRDNLPRDWVRTPGEAIAGLIESPVFGTVFTDHMVTITWTASKGWHDAQLRRREPFLIDPACAVLHYSQEIFEGMKAYKAQDGRVLLFRPEENARRLNSSAERMSMPALPEALFIAAVERLVRADKAWIPGGDGSLYLRPFMFATEPFLGVRPSNEYVFCVIAAPVGAYFKGKAKPITVWISDRFSRAAEGGTGAAKTGGNYANGLAAQQEAADHGCDQVLFLDAREHRWLEELGGMNLFLVMADGRLVTPPLGTILPGITRHSIIELARASGLAVEEAPYSLEQLTEDARSGAVREAFACGTAAVITPIGAFRSHAGEITIANGGEGTVTGDLRRQLVGIQRGSEPDTMGWSRVVA